MCARHPVYKRRTTNSANNNYNDDAKDEESEVMNIFIHHTMV